MCGAQCVHFPDLGYLGHLVRPTWYQSSVLIPRPVRPTSGGFSLPLPNDHAKNRKASAGGVRPAELVQSTLQRTLRVSPGAHYDRPRRQKRLLRCQASSPKGEH